MSNNNSSNKKSKFSLYKLIYNDKYLIIVSIFLAILVWIGTSLSVGTDETKVIKMHIPIQLGDEVSSQLGMEYYSLQDSVEVSVTISGAKYVIGQVTENDLEATFDTSNVNRTGNQSIPIRVKNKSKSLDFDIESTYPSSLDAYFDINSTKTFDVDVVFDKDVVAEGYVFGYPVLSEDKITVSGPKSYVDRIDSAKCNIDFGDLKDLTEPFSQECKIQFEGNDLDTSYISVFSKSDNSEKINTLSVTVPVFKMVTLPVSTTFSEKPEGIAKGIVNVTYSTNRVSAGVLSSADVSTANIGAISFNDLTVGTQIFEFPTSKINGITILDDTEKIEARVTVSSKYSEKLVTINKNNVKIEGVPQGTKARVTSIDDTGIIVLVPAGVNITPNDLSIKCDVSTKTESSVYPLEITVSNNKCWVYGRYNATISIE